MRVVGLMVILLLAGCATSRTSAFKPDACDPSGATAINHDAPRLEVFDDPLRLAQATARGLGERWLDDAPEHVWEGTTRWDTADGFIVVTVAVGEEATYGGGISVEFSSRRSAAFTESALRSLGRELGVTEEGAYSTHASTRQSWLSWGWPTHRHEGSIAAIAPGSGEGYVGFRAFHGLAAARIEVSSEEAIATARAYTRCDLDREGRTEAAGYAFRAVGERTDLSAFGDAFVFVVMVRYTEPAGQESHCGLARQVAVDAVTGAVVGEPIVYCD